MAEGLMNRNKSQLFRHEGLSLKPYRSMAGKLTIGRMNGFPISSRMTDDRGIYQKEAYAMFSKASPSMKSKRNVPSLVPSRLRRNY